MSEEPAEAHRRDPDGDGAAYSLAMLRIAMAAMMLLAPGFHESGRVAAWDRARWVVPEGLWWFVLVIPISVSLVRVAQVIAVIAAVHALIGLRTHLALAALVLSSFYLFAIAQLTGFVWHDMHLLWMCALLSVSPCDRRWAIDAPADGAENKRGDSLRAMAFARALLAAVYFFPGMHKYLTSGLRWATSDNLLNLLYWKWLQYGSPPVLRLDRAPALLKLGGLATLAFELAFPVLMCNRRSRAFAAAFGLLFHAMSQAVLRISFPSLWICYVVLIDPRRTIGRLRAWVSGKTEPPSDHDRGAQRFAVQPDSAPPGAAERPSTRRLTPLNGVGAVLVAGAVLQGARGQMSSYPFACYPTFQWITPNVIPDLDIELWSSDGHSATLVHGRTPQGLRTQRQWGEIFRLAGATGPVDRARLAAYYASAIRTATSSTELPNVKRIRFFRAYRLVAPEHQADPPVARELLWEADALPRLSTDLGSARPSEATAP